MTTQVARDGNVLGTFSDEELTAAIATGTVLPTDFFWREGMTEWAAVSTLLAQPPEPAPQHAAVPPTTERPASVKQLNFIEDLSGTRANSSFRKIEHFRARA